jgi:hypothetical protein
VSRIHFRIFRLSPPHDSTRLCPECAKKVVTIVWTVRRLEKKRVLWLFDHSALSSASETRAPPLIISTVKKICSFGKRRNLLIFCGRTATLLEIRQLASVRPARRGTTQEEASSEAPAGARVQHESQDQKRSGLPCKPHQAPIRSDRLAAGSGAQAGDGARGVCEAALVNGAALNSGAARLLVLPLVGPQSRRKCLKRSGARNVPSRSLGRQALPPRLAFPFSPSRLLAPAELCARRLGPLVSHCTLCVGVAG